MPYVPPHLRNGGTAKVGSVASSSSGNFPSSTGPPPQQRDLGYGFRRPSDSNGYAGNGYGRDRNSSQVRDSRNLGPPEAVWPKWQPSERVRKLQQDQILEIRSRLNVDVEVPADSGPAPPPVESFEDMVLHSNIMKDIAYHEYTSPTPIQAQAMPIALSGNDLLGCAETGSGKTAAFTIPMIQHCLAQAPHRHGDGPLALVLAPTRELAQQIEKEVKAFSRSSEGFKTAIVVGGVQIHDQRSELRSGVQVVVATPGRFIDHLQQGNSSLSRVSYVVLDEADRMLDMGFYPQIKDVMSGLPKKHQTLLFSATMPEEIESLAQEYLNKPVQVKVGKVSSPTANVLQSLEKVDEKNKIDSLLGMFVEEANQAEKSGLLPQLSIVFVERKARCDEVADALIAQGLKAAPLHGGRSQSEREGALRDFRKGAINILVATDIASRGLDIPGVGHVVNLDLPKSMEDYVHRIGRTGRAGASGRATSLYTDRDAFLVTQIRKAIAESQAGNQMAFVTGKAARKKEREEAAAFKEGRLTGALGVGVVGTTTVRVDDKYKHMLVPAAKGPGAKAGVADDAWDD